ncbi:MAG: hypothetical protein AUJ52_15720 [Elusimicrobia bacterium CG1_02_63_36]|nr:MAG: hypothetical protein AUJ52_15720 [Elusimicrobia bacterium CG1_02_63_36]PIP81476.1 MAG: hypothetical protein COR54_20280 [Elusimicrobia bacterium CG22_combo_CG10-13_8_21_14_all_63_91]PJA17024.1 MAG: hypothetical protein COX66_05835 [Elusimicrobia bacterium CG_4_10_14_0_2_um_filter_63_34]PJB25748.1 MAG: hypothetical protein CO113_07090 [Elusimicrobia bacterium CG_4_9_14_3_um_filter_62_55]
MRRFPPFLLCALLSVGASAAPSADAKDAGATADKDTVELVDSFLKADTAKIPAGAIPVFMKIDPETLPERQRIPYEAKKAELQALRMAAESKRKPPIRMAGKEPVENCPREKGTKKLIDTLMGMGFGQLDPQEVLFLEKKTRCTECELIDEFGLKVTIVPPDKKKKEKYPMRYYLMHQNSPAWALIAAYRKGSEGGTNFFGVGFFGACR